MSTMTGRLVPGNRYRHIRAFESEIKPKIEEMRLHVSAEMTTTPIYPDLQLQRWNIS
jgi:hypothetical protein